MFNKLFLEKKNGLTLKNRANRIINNRNPQFWSLKSVVLHDLHVSLPSHLNQITVLAP